MTTNYQVNGSNFEDNFIRRDLFSQGGLWLTGLNNYSQLGTGNATNYSSPVQTIASGSNWKQIGVGRYHTASIKTDGTLWLWGYNNYGQLGTSSVTTYNSPVQTVSGGTDWKQVAGGRWHSAAIKTDGTLWSWGRNSYGALGNNTITSSSSPVQTVSGGTNWKLVSAGAYHSVGIKTDGTLWSWGYNQFGMIGDNTSTSKSSPVQTVAGGTNWKQVSTMFYFDIAIKTDGTLWLWGRNTYGQLGNNDTAHQSSPVQTVAGGTNWKSVSCGRDHSMAIKTDNTSWLFGHNGYGQLGNNTITHKSSPIQTVAGGTNWKQFSAGYYWTSAIKTDGTLWTFGNNNNGQLGTNDTVPRSSPVQTVAGGTNWKLVSCSNYTLAAITDIY